MPAEQTYASHAALDPITHFTLIPLVLATIVLSIYLLIHDGARLHWEHALLVGLAISCFLLNIKTRVYSLKVQDRVIRLEERMRIATLAPSANVLSLTTQQLIALRFAPDAELPSLVAKTLSESLEPKAIKAAIVTWRPDYERI